VHHTQYCNLEVIKVQDPVIDL